MRKIIGNEICVFLKVPGDEVVGLLVDVTKDELYLRDASEISKLYIIPRDNVKYCTTDVLPTTERTLPPHKTRSHDAYVEENMRFLDVFVDGNPVANIPVHPTFNLNEWHDGIAQIILSNKDVQVCVSGKIQKSIEYSPGKVYITTGDTVPIDKGQKAFVMGGSVSDNFLNPSQMVSRLNKSVRRGKNDDEEEA